MLDQLRRGIRGQSSHSSSHHSRELVAVAVSEEDRGEREMRKNSSRLFTKWLLVDYVNFEKNLKGEVLLRTVFRFQMFIRKKNLKEDFCRKICRKSDDDRLLLLLLLLLTVL